MSDKSNPVENEIEDHKSDLITWVNKVTSLTIPESRKGVADRFVRDCNILTTDLDEKEKPTMADLVDFTDRRNSLEIQFLNITNDFN